MKTILALCVDYLKKHGVARPRLVGETLLSHCLQMKRIDLYMQYDRPISEDELVFMRQILARAGKQEPMEYIMGQVDFYHTSIQLSQDVLIPRVETEILIDLVCKRLSGIEKSALDLCTGSGCLAVALKHAHPKLEVVGVDLSEKALEVAKKNSDQVIWMQGDLTQPVLSRKFDLVLCNPPYISEKEYENLDKGVKEFEPKIALVSGPTGLEFYERLAKELPSICLPDAKIFLEIGSDQKEAVLEIFSNNSFSHLLVEEDWAGHSRFFSCMAACQ